MHAVRTWARFFEPSKLVVTAILNMGLTFAVRALELSQDSFNRRSAASRKGDLISHVSRPAMAPFHLVTLSPKES